MRVLVLSAVVIATAALAGCSPSQQGAKLLAEGSAIGMRVDATTSSSGWRVDCTSDQYTASKRCFAATFGTGAAGSGVPFQVYYENGRGPNILAGYNDFPGREATVRIDDGVVRKASEATAIVSALSKGTTAFVIYNVWPEGERRMTVNIAGFAEAYAKLQALR